MKKYSVMGFEGCFYEALHFDDLEDATKCAQEKTLETGLGFYVFELLCSATKDGIEWRDKK
jgi:hypothetical protein